MARWRPVVAAAAILMLVLAACGDDGSGDVAQDSTPATSTTTAPPESTTSLPTPLDVEVITDVRYHDDIDIAGFKEPLLDVYAPIEGGPWPVVVMLPGGGGRVFDKTQWTLLANQVAAEGAVAVTVTQGGNPSEADRHMLFPVIAEQTACVFAFVNENAETYRADPTDVTAYGGSGGANAAGATIWGGPLSTDGGCLADAEPAVPVKLALAEGDWLLAPSWDADLAGGFVDYDEATVWDDLELSENVDVHLILGTETPNGVNHRISVGDPFDGEECGREIAAGTGIDLEGDGECQWWELRDPDGAFREDAERLGLFDDGWIDVSEFSLLLADRLEAEDQEPTITDIEGLSHEASPVWTGPEMAAAVTAIVRG